MKKIIQKEVKIKVAIVGSKKNSGTTGLVREVLDFFRIPHITVSPPRSTTSGSGGEAVRRGWFEALERAGAQVFIVPISGREGTSFAGEAARLTERPVLAFLDSAGRVVAPKEILQALPGAGMPPFASLAVGEAGAKNSALMAAQILALKDPALARRVAKFRERQTRVVLRAKLPAR